jgi:hypothetical protein
LSLFFPYQHKKEKKDKKVKKDKKDKKDKTHKESKGKEKDCMKHNIVILQYNEPED